VAAILLQFSLITPLVVSLISYVLWIDQKSKWHW
jgi:hypothetical protein